MSIVHLLAQTTEGAEPGYYGLGINAIISTVLYSLLGLVLFLLAYFIIEKIVPYPVRKEIEEDQNIALGVIIGSMVIGLAIIIAAAISG
ncbi:MAG: DUF350 domain-containing protein [Sumerlaeia bacterium]